MPDERITSQPPAPERGPGPLRGDKITASLPAGAAPAKLSEAEASFSHLRALRVLSGALWARLIKPLLYIALIWCAYSALRVLLDSIGPGARPPAGGLNGRP
jgi:hypothetical protein